MKAVVVIPTYNEAENIVLLLPKIFEVAKSHKLNLHVLVVDGNSPDGTGGLVEDMCQEDERIHLLVEHAKAGLGAAYKLGFIYAIKQMHADIVIEMDADFQHNPDDLPRFIAAIEQGHDYVIGSRYTKGGSIPKEWAFYRKFLSIGGNIFSKIVLGIYNVSDFTTGYKATRVKGVLDAIDLDAVSSAGFAYKMDLLYRIHAAHAKIFEIPIAFGLRDRGDSKMERDNALDSLRVVFLIKSQYTSNRLIKFIFGWLYTAATVAMQFLAKPESKSFIKFVLVGFTGLGTDATIFNILRITHFSTAASALISGVIAMITTFLLNNSWSFGDRKLQSNFKKLISFFVYMLSSSFPIFIRTWIVNHAVISFGDTFIVSNLAFMLGVVFGLFWNYTVYSKIIWRKSV